VGNYEVLPAYSTRFRVARDRLTLVTFVIIVATSDETSRVPVQHFLAVLTEMQIDLVSQQQDVPHKFFYVVAKLP